MNENGHRLEPSIGVIDGFVRKAMTAMESLEQMGDNAPEIPGFDDGMVR